MTKSCSTAGAAIDGLRIQRLLYLCAIAVPFVIIISAQPVLPGWIRTLDKPVRRAMTEASLYGELVVYFLVLLAGLVGTPVFGLLLARSGSRGAVSACSQARLRFRTVVPRIAFRARGRLGGLAKLEASFAVGTDAISRCCPWGIPDCGARRFERGGRAVLAMVVGRPNRGLAIAESNDDRTIACEILAYPGDSLEMQHHKLAGLTRRPDAVIIYSGHNEFAARYEEEREGWQDEGSGFLLTRIANRVCLSSPFYRLAYELISKNRLDRPPSLSLRHHLIDPPICSPVESAAILDDFGRRLEAIVAYCDRIGALPILIVPPANEAGYEPSRSTLPVEVTVSERNRLIDEMRAARALESPDPAQAPKSIRRSSSASRFR